MVLKENSLGQVLQEWRSFFFFFVLQYSVDIFRTLKHFLTNKFSKCTVFNKKVSKLIEQVYHFIKIYGIKRQFCKLSFVELVSLF